MTLPTLLQRLLARARALVTPGLPWHRQRVVRIALGAVSAYALLGFVAVPAALRHVLPGALHDALGVDASVGGVSFNPFSLRLGLRDLAVKESNGVPLVSVQRVVVDLQASGLFRRAWTLSDLSLAQPDFDLVREADGRLNVARVAANLPQEPDSAEDDSLLRLLVHRADISAARVRFRDDRAGTPARTELGPSDLHLERLSTLPE
ncbi:MAG: AsmA family protein, partial [Gammaproteobacteria bacterium]